MEVSLRGMEILYKETGNPRAVFVLIQLALMAPEGEFIEISYGKLGEIMRISEATVGRWVRYLKESGFIEYARTTGVHGPRYSVPPFVFSIMKGEID